MSDKATLFYVYDPMCSWCWGYRPTWLKLKESLKGLVEVKYCVGGLAPDSNEPMPEEMQQFLQQTWHRIAKALGTEFNFDFWQNCLPRRSTYPACRAILVARNFGLEQQMLLAIQQAYYLQAQNPSDIETLAQLAEQISIDKTEFITALTGEIIEQKLISEISQARAMPIQGFPSLVLEYNGKQLPINIDYHNWQKTLMEIKTLLGK